MNQIDRYLFKRYGVSVGAVLLVFVSLMAIYLLVDDLNNFVKYEPSWWQIAKFILLSIPHPTVRFFPIVVLLALVFTLHQVIKWGELTAAMAAGVSLRRISLPFILGGVAMGGIQFFGNEYFAFWCESQAQRVMRYEIKKRPAGAAGPSGIFVRGAENRFYHCSLYDEENAVLKDIQIFQLHPTDRSLARLIQAEKAVHERRQWVFINGQETRLRYDEVISATAFQRRKYDLPETLEDFSGLALNPRAQSYRKLQNHLQVMASSGEDPSRYKPELYLKLTFPGACLIFTLIGMAVAFRFKAGNLTFEMGLSAAFAFAYYMMTGLIVELGYQQLLPAWLAVLTPTVVFGGAALALFLLTRTDYS